MKSTKIKRSQGAKKPSLLVLLALIMKNLSFALSAISRIVDVEVDKCECDDDANSPRNAELKCNRKKKKKK